MKRLDERMMRLIAVGYIASGQAYSLHNGPLPPQVEGKSLRRKSVILNNERHPCCVSIVYP